MPPFFGKERLRWKLALNTPEFSLPQVMPLDLLHLVIHLLRSLSISLLQLIFHLLLRVMLPFEVCWRLSRPFRWHMDKFWWMCLLSFKIYVWIWRVFGILLCLHLLMMSLDCPLAIHHKKRGVFMHVNRGRFYVFVERGRFRLYLGDSWCIHFFFFWLMMYFFLLVVYVRGRHLCIVFSIFIVSCFTYGTIDYCFISMRLFMIYFFVFVWNQEFIYFTCIFHTCVYVFVECFRNI